MSLKLQPIGDVPEDTARVALAVFRKGNLYLTFRNEFGTLYQDADFAALFPVRGQPALPPWRLALVTLVQFLEHLSDRAACEAVRSRIDLKYLLGLELTDPGFDASVLSEFRTRLVAGNAEQFLLDRMLDHLKQRGLVKARGKQRTDSTHVLGAVRGLNMLELVGETLRAALNALSVAAPALVLDIAEPDWHRRYDRRMEGQNLPKSAAGREAWAIEVGRHGFAVLDALRADHLPSTLDTLPMVQLLRQVWAIHFERLEGTVRWRTVEELPPPSDRFNSVYDVDTQYAKKTTVSWAGYKVHLTETCDEDTPHLLTCMLVSGAGNQDVSLTIPTQEALIARDLAPSEHIVDMGYVSASVLASSRAERKIRLVGPARPNSSWQFKAAQGYATPDFKVDWDAEQVTCPQGKRSVKWAIKKDSHGGDKVMVSFKKEECLTCPVRKLCTRSKDDGRSVNFFPRERQAALDAARLDVSDEQWRAVYRLRAGIEGTISLGVRAFELRQARYRGRAKMTVQAAAIGAAINVSRLVHWLEGRPVEHHRTSHFARLARAS